MAVFPKPVEAEYARRGEREQKPDTKIETVTSETDGFKGTADEVAEIISASLGIPEKELGGVSVPGFKTTTHPVTGEILSFPNREEYVDWLADLWGEVLIQEDALKVAKDQVRSRIDFVAEHPEKTRGAVKLKGNKAEITLTRVEKAKYESVTKGQPSVLQVAYEQIEEIRNCISVRFEEKLAAMDKFINSIMEQESDDPEVVELQSALSAITATRTIQQATPSVKVKVI